MNCLPDTVRVLHVDDEPAVAELAAEFLERGDDRFVVETTTDVTAALDRIATEDIDCVVSDYEMPGMDGIEFLSAVREDHPDLPFVLFTGKGSEEIASDAISAGVTDYLRKGTGTDQYELLANRITNAVEQVQAERRLTAERQRFQALFENLSQAVVEVEWRDDEPIVQQVNPSFAQVFGYDETDVIGQSLDDLVVPDGEPDDEIERINRRVRAESGLYSEEVTRETADGARKFLLHTATYGDGSGAFAVYTDITERKRREHEVERRNARLHALFENLPEPAVAYTFRDGDPYVEDVNAAFAEVFGWDTEETVGEPIDDLVVPPERREGAERINDRVLAGDLVDEEVRRHTAAGDGDFRIRNIPVPDGDCIDGYCVYADVTAYKRRERELRRQNERLEEFASVVSHDLRGPLNVAEGRLELAREECDGPHLDAVADAHGRMGMLVDDLLELARQGEPVGDTEPVDLESVSRRCWRIVDTADASLRVETDRRLRADRSRLRQLLENLYRNSVEHSSTSSRTKSDDSVEHGSTGSRTKSGDSVEHSSTSSRATPDDDGRSDSDVTITVGELDDDAGFYVADDGPGISVEDREAVFEAGYSTTDDGTGFGLSIVREVAEAHGWEVGVTDADSGGARFEITGVAFVDE